MYENESDQLTMTVLK